MALAPPAEAGAWCFSVFGAHQPVATKNGPTPAPVRIKIFRERTHRRRGRSEIRKPTHAQMLRAERHQCDRGQCVRRGHWADRRLECVRFAPANRPSRNLFGTRRQRDWILRGIVRIGWHGQVAEVQRCAGIGGIELQGVVPWSGRPDFVFIKAGRQRIRRADSPVLTNAQRGKRVGRDSPPPSAKGRSVFAQSSENSAPRDRRCSRCWRATKKFRRQRPIATGRSP